jgi:hypothetical protein
MATRSTIAMEQPDGRIMQIYCHWDGYLENNGKILKQHYTDRAKIYALMMLGDISNLGEEIGQAHDFDSRNKPETWTTAYARDRGELGTECRVWADFATYARDSQFEEYNYVYRLDGQWHVEYYGCEGGFVTLEQAFNIQEAMDA